MNNASNSGISQVDTIEKNINQLIKDGKDTGALNQAYQKCIELKLQSSEILVDAHGLLQVFGIMFHQIVDLQPILSTLIQAFTIPIIRRFVIGLDTIFEIASP